MGADSIDSSSVGSGKKTTNSEQKWLTSFSENVVLQARIDIVCWKHVLRRVSFFFFSRPARARSLVCQKLRSGGARLQLELELDCSGTCSATPAPR